MLVPDSYSLCGKLVYRHGRGGGIFKGGGGRGRGGWSWAEEGREDGVGGGKLFGGGGKGAGRRRRGRGGGKRGKRGKGREKVRRGGEGQGGRRGKGIKDGGIKGVCDSARVGWLGGGKTYTTY